MKTYLSSISTVAKWTFVQLMVAAWLLASPAAGPAATLVDIATDATDPLNLGDTEPSIAVNPATPLDIAVVTFSGNWSPANPAIMAPVWKSNDGGMTWRKVFQIPRPAPGLSGPGDQKIDFDAAGNLFIAELASSPTLLQDFIYRTNRCP